MFSKKISLTLQKHTRMNHKFYALQSSEDYLTFNFQSISSDRVVAKRIQFVPIQNDLYNLAFGDLDEKGEIDDLIVTNNNDTHQVLATVIQAIFLFLNNYQQCSVYFEGSTSSRTRLYQIILAKEMQNWNDTFTVFGISEGLISGFETERDFDSFIVRLKDLHL